MRTIKFFLIFLALAGYLAAGLVLHAVLIWARPHIRIAAVNRLTFYLMHLFKMIAGLNIACTGRTEILKERGLFIISPHVGYIDGIVLGTLAPGSFTTKEEIRHVPFFGQVVAVGASIFVDRRKKTRIVQYVNLMTDRLKHKINVFNFPEGHATDGTEILPFYPSFFNAPLKANAPIVPVTIDYEKVDGRPIRNREDVYCYNGKPLVKHLWNILKFKRIDISVHILDRIEIGGHGNESKDRKFISDLCHKRLSFYKRNTRAQE